MVGRLDGKVAIVTGSAMGIGKSIAKLFAFEGATLVVADIEETAGKATAAEIQAATNRKTSFVRTDVTRLSSVTEMTRFCNQLYGRIDIVCQNVGIYPSVTINEMTETDWDHVQSINLRSCFFCVKACLPFMMNQKYGKIVFTSSITGPKTAIAGMSHYAASKSGINGFIRAAALELAKYNITVNGVEPGTILTNRLKQTWPEEYIRRQEKSIPLGRLGLPEDVAFAMLFLASDESKYVTGQTIVVDGGQTLPEEKSQ